MSAPDGNVVIKMNPYDEVAIGRKFTNVYAEMSSERKEVHMIKLIRSSRQYLIVITGNCIALALQIM